MNYEEALSHCIFRYTSGSHAYGTNRPDSDEDYRGVFIAPLSKAFDLFQSNFVGGGPIASHLKAAIADIETGFTQEAIEKIKLAMEPEHGDLKLSEGTLSKPGVDEELHELRKFFKLAAKSNPNILEFLYVDRLITLEMPIWTTIRAHRDLFLSKKARYTFSGYAHAQLERIQTHRGYLLNPPDHKPTRGEFGLNEETLIAKENQHAILSLPDKWINETGKDYVRREKAYHKALAAFNSYRKWVQERNPDRKAMEAKYGFDVKHAMHLIRLCRMGIEIIRDGVVNVYRPDREELKGVLRGEWSYEKLVEYAKGIDTELDALYKTSPLQDRPAHEKIKELYISICERHYGIKIA